jgi:hypothetical protein
MEMRIIIGDTNNNELEMLNLGAVCAEWEFEDLDEDDDDEDDLVIPMPPDEESEEDEDEDENDAKIKGTLRMQLNEGANPAQMAAAIQEYMQYNADPTHMTVIIEYSLNGVPVYSHICEGGYLDLMQLGSTEPMTLEMEVYDFEAFVPPTQKVSH